MMCRLSLAFVLGAAVLCAAAGCSSSSAGTDKAGVDVHSALQGHWVSGVKPGPDGISAAEASNAPVQFTFSGHDVSSIMPDALRVGKFRVDQSYRPVQIDLDFGNEMFLGICQVNGRYLKLCLAPPGQPRPAEFDGSSRSGNVSLTVIKVP